MTKTSWKSVIGLAALMAVIDLLFMVSASAEVIELNLNNHHPAVSAPAKAMTYWAEAVEKMCGGRVKITIHHNSTLLKGSEALRGIQSSVAAGGYYVLDRQDGFSLNSFITLPFMGYPSQREAEDMYKEMIKQYPELAAEYQGVTIIGLVMMSPTGIHTIEKPVTVPGDLEGMRIQGAEATTAESIGATAVQLDIADLYTSLDTKLIDGFINHVPGLMVFNVMEMLHAHTYFGPGGINMTPLMLIMNTEILDSLPADVREKMMGSGPIWEEKMYALDTELQKEGYEFCVKRGDTIINLTLEQIKVWYGLVKGPIHDKWIKENEEKGLPAKKIYEQVMQYNVKTQKKYSTLLPH